MKEQYALQDQWLGIRVKELIPQLMKECDLNLWVIICSEYNEDPVFRTITPALMQKSASRLSCLMFSLTEEKGFRALSLSRPNGFLLEYYEQGYDPKQEDQWDAIRRVIAEHKEGRIAVNVSSNNGMADGLSKRLYDQLKASEETKDVELLEDTPIAIRYLETRINEELALYPKIYEIAMTIQKEAYSRNVITPGATTTTDVEWYILQRINDMGFSAWFSPDVDVQRKGSEGRLFGEVIQEGDLIHTDMGLVYLGLCTDSQRLGYILKEGETEVPEGLMEGFRKGNRFQDIVCENMIEDRSGDEIFLASMDQAKKEGLQPMLYTHPIGYYGHGAGPLFGLYDAQRPVPLRGELPLKDRTCYALELNVKDQIPEWNGQDVYFYMEETVGFVDGKTIFMDPKGRKEITTI